MKKLISVVTLALLTNLTFVHADTSLDEVIARQEQKLKNEREQVQAQMNAINDMRDQASQARKSRETAAKITVPVAALGIVVGGVLMKTGKSPITISSGLWLGVVPGTLIGAGGTIYLLVKSYQIVRLENALAKAEKELVNKMVIIQHDQELIDSFKNKQE